MPEVVITVLIVECDPRRLLRAEVVLRDAGFATLSAVSRADAEALCGTFAGEISLAVMDVALEGTDGLDVLPSLSCIRPTMRLLYTSSSADGNLGDGLGIGAPILARPFTAAELLAAVREMLSVLDLSRSRAA
jgi:DNA-binding response OmpR family regulator